VLDFGMLPPEINSGRMYSGPGAGSMLTASVAWDALAAELRSAAASYGAVVTGLTSGAWLGPSSVLMAAAAAPYVAWLDSTAGQAEESAARAKAAAAAYEAAFAATVPPPVIAANRAQLMALLATNFFGQNSPAIAATEAQYGEMWAQDAAAMYSYAGASSAASAVTPFTAPRLATSGAGLADQADAVTKASGTPAGSAAQTAASTTAQLASTATVPQALQQLSSASASTTDTSLLGGLDLGQGAWGLGLTTGNLTTIFKQMFGFTPYFYTGIGSFDTSIAQQLTTGPGGPTAGAGGAWYPTPQFAGLGGVGGWGSPTSVSASVGQAGTVGRLSVPPTWASATPQALETGPGLLSTHAGSHLNPGTSGLLRGIPLTGTGLGRRAAGGFVHRYGFRHSVMPRPPSAG
jgi:PPE-repeat protein